MNNAVAVRSKIDLALPADILGAQFDAAAPLRRVTMYWMNGNPALKNAGGIEYTGGWCIDGEKITADALDPDVFNLYSLTNSKNKEYTAYGAPVVQAALLGWRESWTERSLPQGARATFRRDYFPGSRSVVEIAAFVRGCSVPVELQVKGMNSSKLKAAYNKAVSDLRAAFKRDVPPYAFYLGIGGEVDKEGKPAFTVYTGEDGKSSSVVHIAPRWTISNDALKAAMVPPDTLELCKDFAATYLKQWKVEHYTADVVAEEGSF